jgi:hypothetical protein
MLGRESGHCSLACFAGCWSDVRRGLGSGAGQRGADLPSPARTPVGRVPGRRGYESHSLFAARYSQLTGHAL